MERINFIHISVSRVSEGFLLKVLFEDGPLHGAEEVTCSSPLPKE